jgi:hypothetical protein
MVMHGNNPVARQTDLVVQELKGELLIYDLLVNKAYCLNETSALVYQLCDGSRSVREISGQLSRELKSPVPEDLIWVALEQLKKSNLLAAGEELEISFGGGLSRREAIRRVGLASVIALPVISSLVAPTAADAQSGGGTCPSNVCIPPGQDACAGCTGTQTFTVFASTNGSCTFSTGVTINQSCNPGTLIGATDIRRS